MSVDKNEESLAGIHSELKRLNSNLENIISKVDHPVDKDNVEDDYIQGKIESAKKRKLADKLFIIGSILVLVGLYVYDSFIKPITS